VAFAAGLIVCRGDIYAAVMFAVTYGAFKSFDLFVVMDRAIVATQARGIGGLG
jgi:hypothetical protein